MIAYCEFIHENVQLQGNSEDALDVLSLQYRNRADKRQQQKMPRYLLVHIIKHYFD